MSSQWKCSNSSDSQSFCLDSWTWTTMTNRKLPATTIGTKWNGVSNMTNYHWSVKYLLFGVLVFKPKQWLVLAHPKEGSLFLPIGFLWYCIKKLPCGPKGISHIYRHFNGDVCQAVDRAPCSCYPGSFYHEFLIPWDCRLAKLSLSH